MVKAVLFDLDGTLADSLLDLSISTNYAISKFGYKPQPTESFRLFAGDGMAKMIERALPENTNKENEVSRIMPVFLDYYGNHFCDNTTAYEGVVELIDNIKSKGIAVAVVTNKAQEMAEKVVLKLYGGRFDLILGKRDGVPPKPDPTSALMAMRELNAKPSECIFVGDSKMDVMAGVNSGAYPIGVLWGFREKEELISGGAKRLIEKPQELLAIIDSLR